MKYLTKNKKTKDFWVENYNEEQKTFLINIGFEERDNSHIPKGFGINSYMFFNGTGLFCGWSQKETATIYKAIESDYGKIKVKKADLNL